jgi:molybdate transport system substrate-binding protein
MGDATITVFSGLALKDGLVDDIIPRFSARAGERVVAEFQPTAILEQAIRNGRVPDVLIGVSTVVESMVTDGYFLPTTGPFIASAVGIALPPGYTVPTFDDASQFADFLLSARSVAYSRTGASGIYFADLLSRLGIADQVNARATILEGGFTAVAIKDGRADMAIQQISELLSVRGVQVADALPPDVRQVTSFTAAISVDASSSRVAHSFVDDLRTEESKTALLNTGLSLVAGT